MSIRGMESLRSRFLLLLGCALIPLVVAGLWLGRTADRIMKEFAARQRDPTGATLLHDAMQRGVVAIVVVALLTLMLAVLFTRRITHSLEDLADATQAVADGNLDRRVSERSASEAGRVGRAFNAMTQTLRETLRRLAQREALVAVGEFAASLAHEVRNPLTSIRIDLQRVDEQLNPESPLRTQLGRALREVDRLDQTVSGALRIARSGNITLNVVDLNIPLQRAIEVATPSFARQSVQLTRSGVAERSLMVRGDDAALEQLFLNLLLNAAQSLGEDGDAGVTVVVDGDSIQVDIWDTGAGMTPDQLERAFDPLFSTKRDGTGLGLSVVRQIVNAHGGFITIDSALDAGTTVSVRLAMVR